MKRNILKEESQFVLPTSEKSTREDIKNSYRTIQLIAKYLALSDDMASIADIETDDDGCIISVNGGSPDRFNRSDADKSWYITQYNGKKIMTRPRGNSRFMHNPEGVCGLNDRQDTTIRISTHRNNPLHTIVRSNHSTTVSFVIGDVEFNSQMMTNWNANNVLVPSGNFYTEDNRQASYEDVSDYFLEKAMNLAMKEALILPKYRYGQHKELSKEEKKKQDAERRDKKKLELNVAEQIPFSKRQYTGLDIKGSKYTGLSKKHPNYTPDYPEFCRILKEIVEQINYYIYKSLTDRRYYEELHSGDFEDNPFQFGANAKLKVLQYEAKNYDIYEYIYPIREIMKKGQDNFAREFAQDLKTKILEFNEVSSYAFRDDQGNFPPDKQFTAPLFWKNIEIAGARPMKILDMSDGKNNDDTKYPNGTVYADVPSNEEWLYEQAFDEFNDFYYRYVVIKHNDDQIMNNPNPRDTKDYDYQVQVNAREVMLPMDYVQSKSVKGKIDSTPNAVNPLYQLTFKDFKQNPFLLKQACDLVGVDMDKILKKDSKTKTPKYSHLKTIIDLYTGIVKQDVGSGKKRLTNQQINDKLAQESEAEEQEYLSTGRNAFYGNGINSSPFAPENIIRAPKTAQTNPTTQTDPTTQTESILCRWNMLFEGVGPEIADQSAYWHFTGEENAENPNQMSEAKMGTTYYRNKYPEEELFNQLINIEFLSQDELDFYNKCLVNNGMEPLNEGENWIKAENVKFICDMLDMVSQRIKLDRNTIFKVSIAE